MSSVREQPHYFGAGPALLPNEVIGEAAEAIVNYQGLGIGVAEISHRSKQAIDIINETKAKITKLLDVPDTHEVFFAQGGGTAGFASIPCNLIAPFVGKYHRKPKAGYFVTGSWSLKAYQEAVRLGIDAHIVADSRREPSVGDKKFVSIPSKESWDFPAAEDLAYVYYCDNETVGGLEFPLIPEVPEGVELVADMSSNFLSRKVDVSKFGVIFGGAQKNIGIAGVSLYIIKKTLLENKASDEELRNLGLPLIPIFLDFSQIVSQNSAYNTISILAVYVVDKVMDHLIAKGGLAAQEKESDEKAHKLYAVVDKYPTVYKTWVAKSSRSRMNVVFEVQGEANQKEFLEQAEKQNLTGLKGHRSVGGIRVSNYNAVKPESVDILVAFMEKFAQDKK